MKKNGMEVTTNHCKQIKNGRNSQVYLIEHKKNKFILKRYHEYKRDQRNRLKNEFGFLSFLKKNNIKFVADPIAFDSEKNLGLFSYIPGERPDQINQDLISQACDFIRKINNPKLRQTKVPFPEASEACFSILSHIKCVKKRVVRLIEIAPNNPIEDEVVKFVDSCLKSSLDDITNNILEKYSEKNLKKKLSKESKVLSPSDFGFQNTLIYNKAVHFLDFEYAGIDDPAKLICDFGCHPEIPIKSQYLEKFKDSFYLWLDDAENLIKRSEILMPLYRLKWSCIMLNEFTPAGRFRRSHAGEILNYEGQLQKSKNYFEKHLN